MLNRLFLLFLLLFALPLGSCRFFLPFEDWDVNARFDEHPPAPYTPPQLANPEKFSFIYFADIQVDERLVRERRAPAVQALAAYLREYPADFLVSGGDNTERATEEEYNFIDAEIKSLGLPIYWCLGNHDLFGDGWLHWKRLYGSSIRTVRAGNTTIYILDNANGTFGEKQRRWFEEQLQHDPARHRFAVMHYPLFLGANYMLDGTVLSHEHYTFADIFERHNVRHILMGHSHIYRRVMLNGVDYITASALKENSPGKMFLRVDIDGGNVKTTVIPMLLEGYQRWEP